jgi:hypothetical protein
LLQGYEDEPTLAPCNKCTGVSLKTLLDPTSNGIAACGLVVTKTPALRNNPTAPYTNLTNELEKCPTNINHHFLSIAEKKAWAFSMNFLRIQV